MLLIAATIVNAKPTQKSIASTPKQQPRQPRQPNQLLTANLKEKSIFLLELKWSDKATKIVKLESLGDIDEDCFYKGSYIEDSDSTILITGCELKNILIQSPIFGDYLGTITVNGTFKVSEEAPLYDDALENPDWPTVAIPEDDALEKCECEYGDVECLINCLESTIRTENQRKKRSDDYYSSDCECGDDDACWEDFVQTGECPLTRPKFDYSGECECREDDSCWEDFLQTGECPLTRPEFECECEDWDKECWTFCLVSTVTNAKETETANEFGQNFISKIWAILKKIFGFGSSKEDYLTEYALENPEFEGDTECECEDGDDECWINCLESTITNAKLYGNEYSYFISIIFKILKKIFKIFTKTG